MPTLHERVIAIEHGAFRHDKQIKAIRQLVRECEHLKVETRKDLRALAMSVRRLR